MVPLSIVFVWYPSSADCNLSASFILSLPPHPSIACLIAFCVRDRVVLAIHHTPSRGFHPESPPLISNSLTDLVSFCKVRSLDTFLDIILASLTYRLDRAPRSRVPRYDGYWIVEDGRNRTRTSNLIPHAQRLQVQRKKVRRFVLCCHGPVRCRSSIPRISTSGAIISSRTLHVAAVVLRRHVLADRLHRSSCSHLEGLEDFSGRVGDPRRLNIKINIDTSLLHHRI